MRVRLLPKLFKGLIYGNVIGIVFGLGIYFLAGSAIAFFDIGATPGQIAALVYGAGVLGGIGMEYADWMDKKG